MLHNQERTEMTPTPDIHEAPPPVFALEPPSSLSGQPVLMLALDDVSYVPDERQMILAVWDGDNGEN